MGGQKTTVHQAKLIKYFNEKHTKIVKIDCGGNHSSCLTQMVGLYCFGRNYNFECGNGDNRNNVIKPQLNVILNESNINDIKCGSQHNVAKTDHHDFYLWGTNDFNQCLIVDENKHFVEIQTKY